MRPFAALFVAAIALACGGALPPAPPPIASIALARPIGGVPHVRLGPIDAPGETVTDGISRAPVADPQWMLAAGTRWTLFDGRVAGQECPVVEVVALSRGPGCPAIAYAALGCTVAGPAVALAPGETNPEPWLLVPTETGQKAGAELAISNASAWREVVEAARRGDGSSRGTIDVERFQGRTGDSVLVQGAFAARSAWALFVTDGDQLGLQLGPWVKGTRATGLLDLDADEVPEVLVADGLDFALRGLDGRVWLEDVLPPCP